MFSFGTSPNRVPIVNFSQQQQQLTPPKSPSQPQDQPQFASSSLPPSSTQSSAVASTCRDTLCWMTLLNPHVYVALFLGVLVGGFVVASRQSAVNYFSDYFHRQQNYSLPDESLESVEFNTVAGMRSTSVYSGSYLKPSITKKPELKYPKPVPKHQQYVVETYYKEYALTGGHLATFFRNSSHELTQPERIASIKILIAQLASFLEQHHITYWIDWGTLLGAYRSRAVIPWDDDGDFAILSGKGVQAVARKVLHHKFNCDCLLIVRYNYSMYDIPFMFVDRTNGAYIDLFQYVQTEAEVTNRMFSSYSHNNQPLSVVYPLAKCELHGRLYSCPAKAEDYLLRIYGDLSIPWKYQDWDYSKTGGAPLPSFTQSLAARLAKADRDFENDHEDDLLTKVGGSSKSI